MMSDFVLVALIWVYLTLPSFFLKALCTSVVFAVDQMYTKLKKDPTSSTVSKVTKKLIELRDNNLIEQQEYFKLKPTGTQPPRFYGLPKIHKDGAPM